jgi:hypothetical protein
MFLKLFLILCGFFCGGFLPAFFTQYSIGNVTQFAPFSISLLLLWNERLLRWRTQFTPPVLFFQYMNIFKIGLFFGLFVDAFKVGS